MNPHVQAWACSMPCLLRIHLGVILPNEACGLCLLQSFFRLLISCRAWSSNEKSVSFRHEPLKLPLMLSTKPFCMGFPGTISCHSMPVVWHHFNTAILVILVPLSLIIVLSMPRRLMMASSWRVMRWPDRDVSTMFVSSHPWASHCPASIWPTAFLTLYSRPQALWVYRHRKPPYHQTWLRICSLSPMVENTLYSKLDDEMMCRSIAINVAQS